MPRAQRRGTRGKFYEIKSQATCAKEGITYMQLPKGVGSQNIIVLNNPNHENMVKFATITSGPGGAQEDYYPIAPAPRRPYAFQLHIRGHNTGRIGHPKSLSPRSYVKVEEHVIPANMLVELLGTDGDHLMLRNESIDKLERELKARRVVTG